MVLYNKTSITDSGIWAFGGSMLVMDNRPELPSITTHFAEYFPDHKANTAPLTPSGQFPSWSPSLKRKRSDPIDISGEALHRPTKQPLNTSGSSWPEPTRVYPPERDAFHQASRDFRPRADSAWELSTNNHSHKNSLSPPRLKNPGYHVEPPRDEVRRPASTSAVGRSVVGDRPRSAHTYESQPVQARLLPPITGLDPSPASAETGPLKAPWQQDPRPSLPAAIEPKTQYQPLDREAGRRPEQPREQRGSKRERSPEIDRPLDDIKTPRRQALENRYHDGASLYRRIPGPLSPPDIHERPRTMHRMQTQLPPWDPGPPSQQTSPTDTSPPSAHPSFEPATRYSWDPSSLYDNMRSSHRKRRGNLPKESTALLNEWYNQHSSYPYPKEAEKQELQNRTGLHMSQISNWFINARRRRRPSASSRTAEGLPRTLEFDFSGRKQ